jgi:hypothetical protein
VVAGAAGAPEAAEGTGVEAELAAEATGGAVEVAGAAAEETADVTGDGTEETGAVAELTAAVTGEVAEPTADVAGEVAEPVVEVMGGAGEAGADAVDVWVDVRGDRAAVAAWAGWENSSMTARIPAAASAACTAARAMRRTIGCMSSSHSTRNRVARLPSGGGANLAHTEMLFGHHRTV